MKWKLGGMNVLSEKNRGKLQEAIVSLSDKTLIDFVATWKV